MTLRSRSVGAAVTRRTFLASTGSAVALTVMGVPLSSPAAPPGPADIGTDGSPVPGVASQRIDGLAKVTGQKVYARDFNARDMPGWPDTQWHALYLAALTTSQAFKGLDLSSLPAEAQPTRVVLGNELSPTMRAPQLDLNRDLHIDERIAKARAQRLKARKSGGDVGSFNLPDELLFDLIVVPGNVPNFLGQAVALLLFDSLAGYRAARRAMAFNDAAYQRYGAGNQDGPPLGTAFTPKTTYVKYRDQFSYATADPDTYMDQVPQWQERINDTLDNDASLIRQPFSAEMRAMDPMFMEPEAGLVWIDSGLDTMHLVLGTQSPDGDIANILSMYDSTDAPFPLKAVNLTSCYPGGGFGGRDSSPFSLMLALAGAYSGGNPVRLAHDRFDQFRVGLKRHGADLSGELAVDPDMRLQSVQMTLTFDGGGRRNLSPYVASLGALCAGGSYTIPMANIYAEAVHTQNVSGGSQRGFGGPQAFFAFETALDDLAAAQGWDPLELRAANLLTEGDTTVVGGPVEQPLSLAEMLEITRTQPLWAERETIQSEYAARGLTYGTGLALSLQAYGTSGDGMVASVLLNRDGSLTVQSDAVDMGNGSATTLGVVIGPILGANAAQVDMGCYTLFGMTGLTTSDPEGRRWDNPNWTAKSVGSSSACLTALHQVHTVRQTAQALFQAAILPAAAQIWGTPPLSPDEVAWRDGALVLTGGGGTPLPLSQLGETIYGSDLPAGALGHGYFQNTWAEASFPTPGGLLPLQLDGLAFYPPGGAAPVPVTRQDTVGPDSASKRYSRYVWAPCVNVVGLTADTTSGAVQVENVLSVLNAGQIHVPQLVSGQSQGGVAMAISYTLLEDMPPGMEGPANGMWNLNRYHLARAQDVPLRTDYTPGERGQQLITLAPPPGGAPAGRGIAEAVMCSVPPAISNALRDATGKRFTSLPITPAKILEGLGQ
ncbi:xanthine dehydrogenase family protein molybdopterin-binding subunit [Salipiger abyssi]|uniref:Aerobic-type carbon monoxide dehydrogenase, large subunit CoxL/CutL-like protein n=1 Tax=Salipiger abyssi TaxID=1250539 RepID=A0A1P8V0W7_9RHOB|nr:molybdopterin cofactor-binding domain-containing protein [Salipiger abyssi]APZ55268.1 aerobic-type carbon monoxide dehydrogenase, large subunit CoxL/CutL-like protein [Salipiger abyssi]